MRRRRLFIGKPLLVKEISKADVAWIVLQAQICIIVTRSRKTAAGAFVESECGQLTYLPLDRFKHQPKSPVDAAQMNAIHGMIIMQGLHRKMAPRGFRLKTLSGSPWRFH